MTFLLGDFNADVERCFKDEIGQHTLPMRGQRPIILYVIFLSETPKRKEIP
jgi:hypothetical protein